MKWGGGAFNATWRNPKRGKRHMGWLLSSLRKREAPPRERVDRRSTFHPMTKED